MRKGGCAQSMVCVSAHAARHPLVLSQPSPSIPPPFGIKRVSGQWRRHVWVCDRVTLTSLWPLVGLLQKSQSDSRCLAVSCPRSRRAGQPLPLLLPPPPPASRLRGAIRGLLVQRPRSFRHLRHHRRYHRASRLKPMFTARRRPSITPVSALSV